MSNCKISVDAICPSVMIHVGEALLLPRRFRSPSFPTVLIRKTLSPGGRERLGFPDRSNKKQFSNETKSVVEG